MDIDKALKLINKSTYLRSGTQRSCQRLDNILRGDIIILNGIRYKHLSK